VVVVTVNLIDDFRFQRLLGLADTRTLTRRWIEERVPEGSSILVEGAIGTLVLEGPQLQETERSLNRGLEEIRRLGGGGGLWTAKLRAATAGGARRFDVHKVTDVTSDLLRTAPAYVVVRSDHGRRLLDADARYRLVFGATSDSPALFRTVPLLSSRDIERLRRIPLLGDPQFRPGPDLHVYRASAGPGAHTPS
jgi:hypothetical protein